MRLRLGIGLPHSRGLPAAVAAAVAADQLGYHSVWVPEAYGSDAVTVLAYLAARTSTIGLASAVLQMPARTPANTAMTAMTLDELSGGRAILGLGVSGPRVVEGWHGVPYRKPLAMTREYVEIVRRAIRRTEPLTFDGDLFRIPADERSEPLMSAMRPHRPEVPIYLAANGPRNIGLAAEIADGWLPTLYAPEYDETVAPAVESGLARRDPARSALMVACGVPTFIGPDVQRCRDLARPYLALYIGGMGSREQNFYKDVVTRYGYGEAAARIQDLYLSGRAVDAAAAVPDDLVDVLALVGPAETIRERLAIWDRSRVDVLIIRSVDVRVLETVRELAEQL
ncbi:LLM class F420-dependent oxidoreductase [Pseudofrankia inefficax]|uniref:LLM class F420-dependent oxidoreductase n=1 Tax=Pseudofrankia inefficax (strain DSM 45817 / CECT 9037 / DDB 130130 / EuI1c) TaxID=298654 RepID=UPI0006747AC3|nr:LLM class F420-dependent oxidoreductase [Pseudofrankia inefficax]